MWAILKPRFQDLSPRSATDILHQLLKRTMSDFADVSQYCATYEAALDRIAGMIPADSPLTAQGAEIIIQGFMLANTGESYAPLVAHHD